jgi:hypothetical protein
MPACSYSTATQSLYRARRVHGCVRTHIYIRAQYLAGSLLMGYRHTIFTRELGHVPSLSVWSNHISRYQIRSSLAGAECAGSRVRRGWWRALLNMVILSPNQLFITNYHQTAIYIYICPSDVSSLTIFIQMLRGLTSGPPWTTP